jgi:hypothetical protein
MVEVEWYDAADEVNGWQDIDEALEHPSKHPVRTIGYYLESKEKHLYLTPTMKGDELAVLSIIPEGCIIKITPLEHKNEDLKWEGNIGGDPLRERLNR